MAATNRPTLTDTHVLPTTEGGCPPIADVDITEIYCPVQDVPIIADIVFVHGLKGHPRDTWLYGKQNTAQSTAAPESTARKSSFRTKLFRRNISGGNESSNSSPKVSEEISYCFWPYDLLSKDDAISQARILLYGYDSHPTHFYKAGTNRMTITQHAENLMHNVAGVREQCQGRPLIFVAHSLGGILVKGALSESRQMTQRQYSDLLSSCHAIVFMGTPHLGAEIAAWGTMMSNIVGALPGGFSTYSSVLRGLEPDSETLYTITRRFSEILNQVIPDCDKIQICSVQEGLGMSSVRGAGSKVVPDYSSKFNRTDIEQSFFNQTANHMTMCKFSSADDQAYKNILRVLKGYFRAIRERETEVQHAQSIRGQAIVLEFAEKLNFPGRLARERQLNNLVAHDDSFDWIWESNFKIWLTSNAKVFWIAGKPASGKSTLVNYIAKHKNTRELVEGAFGKDLLIARFFFDFRGKDGLVNNFEGMRRSLLLQLLTESSTLAAEVQKHFSMKHLDELIMLGDASVLEYVLEANKQPLLFFIDGLDEYQGNKPELLSLINSITKFKVKVCLSSRYEKPFTIAYKNVEFQFRMDILNNPGICAYSESIFATISCPLKPNERHALKRAAETIANISAGVFLWARFATSEVFDRVYDGHEIEDTWIQSIITHMPPDLEEVYARILQSMKEEYKEAFGIIFQLINSAERELELSDLYEATVIAGVEFRSLEKLVTSQDLDRFRRYIGVVGAGLVECFPTERDRRSSENSGASDGETPDRPEASSVRLIHKSVQTYLSKRGWGEILGEQRALGSQHKLWLEICTDYLAGKRVNWSVPQLERENDVGGIVPCSTFYDYARTFLLQHAYRFEQETLSSSRPLIREALNDEFVHDHVRCSRRRINVTDEDMCGRVTLYPPNFSDILCSDVHLAVCHRLFFYLEDASAHCPRSIDPGSWVETITFLPPRPSYPDRRETRKTSSQVRPRASALAVAVVCLNFESDREKRWERSKLMLSLVPHTSRLEDDIMLFAIHGARKTEIGALLTLFPERPLRLRSRLLLQGTVWFDYRGVTYEPSFGPLWEIGGRFDIEETTEVLRLLLAEGEDINSLCGPLGTVLHSVVINLLETSKFDKIFFESMFRLLIAHGADINAAGLNGTVLDYVWKLAHENLREMFESNSQYPPMIESLISMGAKKTKCDPNGLIPSEVQMLTLARNKGPSIEDQQHYFDCIKNPVTVPQPRTIVWTRER